MAFTDVGSTTAGRIYDSSEIFRYDDLFSAEEKLYQEAEKIDTKRKDLIRYFVIGGGAVLILVFLRLGLKKK